MVPHEIVIDGVSLSGFLFFGVVDGSAGVELFFVHISIGLGEFGGFGGLIDDEVLFGG